MKLSSVVAHIHCVHKKQSYTMSQKKLCILAGRWQIGQICMLYKYVLPNLTHVTGSPPYLAKPR